MLKALIKKLVVITLMLSFISCRQQRNNYLLKDYFKDFAYKLGLTLDDYDISIIDDWNIKYDNLNKNVTINDIYESSNVLLEKDYNFFYQNNIFIQSEDLDTIVDKTRANEILDVIKDIINNKTFEAKNIFEVENYISIKKYEIDEDYLICDLDLKDNDIIYLEQEQTYKKIKLENQKYKLIDLNLDDYNDVDIESTFEPDLENSQTINETQTSYKNNKINLLSNRNEINLNGFKITYSFSKNNINVHISKNINNLNFYSDLNINNIKTSFKFNKKENEIKKTYFKLDYNSSSKFGVSKGKYKHFTLNDDIDFSSLDSMLKTAFKQALNNEDDVTIPICNIKTPIPSIPSANIELALGIRLYMSGKIELLLYDQRSIGFETINGKTRFINDSKKDFDFIINASFKSSINLLAGINCLGNRLMDVGIDAGLRFKPKAIIHLYDTKGKVSSKELNYEYDDLTNGLKNNSNVKVCADLETSFQIDLKINSPISLLSKMGVTYTRSLLDTSIDLFKHNIHFEDFMIVKKCSIKDRSQIIENDIEFDSSDKIILDRYLKVLQIGQMYNIEIVEIPNGYSLSDIVYTCDNNEAINLNQNTVHAINIGVTNITISTNDQKYKASITIVVK